MIKKSLADSVLKEALSTGADFAELFLEDCDAEGYTMRSGLVEAVNSTRDHGAGVRLLLGTRSVYSHSNDTSEASLMRIAREAAAAISSAPAGVAFTLASRGFSKHAPIKTPPIQVEPERKTALLRAADKAARAVSEEIAQVTVNYIASDQRVLIANTEGLWVQDRRIRVRGYVTAVASDGKEFQTGSASLGFAKGFEAFEDGSIDMEKLGEEAAKAAVTMLHAPECPAGKFPVVIDGGFGGVIFHEACGHALEATSVALGNSVFCGKLGQKIAADCVSAFDDGTMENEWGTLDVDDEGNPTQRNLLIENGVLKGYLIDKLGSRRMNMPATGSGRRQDHTFAPTSRMNNTYIAPGSDDDDEMIATMGDGLYAKSMGGGQVNPLTGEFTFGVAEGYWVKDGKIVTPVRGAALIGKGSEILFDIDRVGKVMSLGQGMCGSISGSVPAALGQPRIRVKSITVGGKGNML